MGKNRQHNEETQTSMNEKEFVRDDALLDFALNQCAPDETERIARALQNDAEMKNRLELIKNVLAPLDTWTTPPPPASMVSDILDHIAAHQNQAADDQATTIPFEQSEGRGLGGIISLRELVALAACILIFVGILFPGLRLARQNSRMRTCASQMRALGVGASSYAAANSGFLPYAGTSNGPWLVRRGQPRGSNRRHLIPIFRGRFLVNPKLLQCPGDDGKPTADVQDQQEDNEWSILRRSNINVQFMDKPVRITMVVRPFVMPYISDANPLFAGGQFNEDVDPATTNSPSHGGQGQNILHFDGSVGWLSSPMLNRTGDNIWQIGTLRRYQGTEQPQQTTDAFMTP